MFEFITSTEQNGISQLAFRARDNAVYTIAHLYEKKLLGKENIIVHNNVPELTVLLVNTNKFSFVEGKDYYLKLDSMPLKNMENYQKITMVINKGCYVASSYRYSDVDLSVSDSTWKELFGFVTKINLIPLEEYYSDTKYDDFLDETYFYDSKLEKIVLLEDLQKDEQESNEQESNEQDLTDLTDSETEYSD